MVTLVSWLLQLSDIVLAMAMLRRSATSFASCGWLLPASSFTSFAISVTILGSGAFGFPRYLFLSQWAQAPTWEACHSLV